MRTACCLLPMLLTVAAPAADKPKKVIGRIFMGTVFDYRAPKGDDTGRVMLRLVGRIKDKEGRLHYEYQELTFSRDLSAGKLDPRIRDVDRWRYPHLPKDLKDGARIEVYTDPDPDRRGRFSVRGIHADLKQLQEESRKRRAKERELQRKPGD